MYDAIVVISGSNCNKTKFGGWGVSVYEISEAIGFDVVINEKIESELVDGFYLSNFGINRKWKLADKNSTEVLNVLKIRELTEVFGPSDNPSSLAKAESLGFLEAIKIIYENHWQNILIYCDSRYVAQNLNKLIKSSDSNVLKRKDGSNISAYDSWSEIIYIVLKLLSKKINLKWKWIENSLPKKIADRNKMLSKKGQALAVNKKQKCIDVYKEGKIFVPENKCHGFLLQSRMYFIPAIINVTNSNKRYYFCGDHGDNDSWCGKPKSDSTMSVFILDELDPVIELITSMKRVDRVNHNGQVIKLDAIKYSNARNEITSYGKDLLIHDSISGNIVNYDQKEIVLEQRPPYLFFRLYEQLEELYHKLDKYESNSLEDGTFYFDITDKIYTKNKKGICTLNDHFNTSKYIKIMVEKLNQEVTLTIGLELLCDMGLRRITDENPIVRLYIEKIGPILYKYYVYIKTDKACGLFTTTYANSIITIDEAQ